MESELERTWTTEFRIQGEKLGEKLKADFNEHLQKAEKILSERHKMLDKKEKEARDKSKTLDKKERSLEAQELKLYDFRNRLEETRRNLEEDREEIENEKETWRKEEEELKTRYGIKDEMIKLKIGEEIFTTKRSNMMREPKSILAIRFSGRHDPVMVDGAHFFDRDPKYFIFILNYLRKGKITTEIQERNKDDLQKILEEADYYQLWGLKKDIENILQNNMEDGAKTTERMDTMTRKMSIGTLNALRTFEKEKEAFDQKALELVEELRKWNQSISTCQKEKKREIEKMCELIQQSFPKEMLVDPVVIRNVVTNLKSLGQAAGTFTRTSQDRTLLSKVEDVCKQLQHMLPECLKPGSCVKQGTPEQELYYRKPVYVNTEDIDHLRTKIQAVNFSQMKSQNSEDIDQLRTRIQAVNFSQIKCETAAKILSEMYRLQSMIL